MTALLVFGSEGALIYLPTHNFVILQSSLKVFFILTSGDKKENDEPEKDEDTKEGEDGEEGQEQQEPDKEDPRPRRLHRTTSIFLRNLAPSITKQEVEAVSDAN